MMKNIASRAATNNFFFVWINLSTILQIGQLIWTINFPPENEREFKLILFWQQ